MPTETIIPKTSDKDILELSGTVVYQEPEAGSSVNVNGNEYEITETHFDEENTNLDYMVVHNIKEDEYVLIYQGSSEPGDWQDNLITGDPNEIPEQYKEANDAFNDANDAFEEAKSKYKITAIGGNSLGGGLAGYVGNKSDVHTVALNPAPFPGIEENNGRENVTIYSTNGDPLTGLAMSGGMYGRYNGQIVHPDYNSPFFEMIAPNHTGYTVHNGNVSQSHKLDTEQINQATREQYKANGQEIPEPRDGIIIDGVIVEYDLDDLMPTNPFTGKPINGIPIKINAESMRSLANYLNNTTSSLSDSANIYINHANEIVENEGDNLLSRKETLEESISNFLDEYINKTLALDFLKFDSKISLAENVLDMIDDVKEEIEKAINKLKIVDKGIGYIGDAASFYFLGLGGSVISEGIDALHQSDIELYIENGNSIVSSLKSVQSKFSTFSINLSEIIKESIEPAFKGVTDKMSDDGMVDVLKTHYSFIDLGSDTSYGQFKTYKKLISSVANYFEDVDVALANGSGAPSYNFSSTGIEEKVSDSDVLLEGMSEIDTMVDDGLSELIDSLAPFIETIMSDIVDMADSLALICGEAKDYQILIANKFIEFDLTREFVDTIMYYLPSVKTVLEGTEGTWSSVLTQVKPYLETAIFDGTEFYNVMLFNDLAKTNYQAINTTLSEVLFQLGANKGVGVTSMISSSQVMKYNTNTIVDMLERGTIVA